MTIVMARAAMYMNSVEPTSMTLQKRDSVASILSRQCSAQVWARSTSRTRPSRRKRIAPTSAT